MRYRKKPVVIEAEPIHELILKARSNWQELPEWVRKAYDEGDLLFTDKAIDIHTLEGWMRGEQEDMLIQGVQGEIYSCRMEIFEQTYEQVEA